MVSLPGSYCDSREQRAIDEANTLVNRYSELAGERWFDHVNADVLGDLQHETKYAMIKTRSVEWSCLNEDLKLCHIAFRKSLLDYIINLLSYLR